MLKQNQKLYKLFNYKIIYKTFKKFTCTNIFKYKISVNFFYDNKII